MDKYEYKLRSEEIKSLIKERNFIKAVEIADTIDWTRVRSVSMLCTISDLYKINRRYKEAKEVLLKAYDRHPGGRTILYSLCELCIKTDDVVGAIEYYKEFVQLAPTDSGKFILQYKIYEAQEVSLEERVAVLEELKKRDPHEKWGYELAYLYHRIGLSTKCVEACDDLILWFREGKYIKKAMELKMLHQPLSPDQEALYRGMITSREQVQYDQQTKVFSGVEGSDTEFQVKTVDVSKYNTINLQKELAESMKEVLVADNDFSPLYSEIPEEMTISQQQPKPIEEVVVEESPTDFADSEVSSEINNEVYFEVDDLSSEEEMQIRAKTEDESLYINYEVSASEPELSAETEKSTEKYVPGSITEAIMAPMMQETDQLQELVIEDGNIVAKTPVLNEEPAEDEAAQEEISVEEEIKNDSVKKEAFQNDTLLQDTIQEDRVPKEEKTAQVHSRDLSDTAAICLVEAAKGSLSDMIREQVAEAMENALREERPSIREVMQGKATQDLSQVNPPEKMGRLLSQEYDGQIRFVVPEEETVEKQITGQLNLEDILAEWEKTKKENEEKRKLKTQQRFLEHTGTMFTEFEEKIRDGILEKLEKNEEIPNEQPITDELPAVEELEEIEDIATTEETDITDSEELTTAETESEEAIEELEDISEDVTETDEGTQEFLEEEVEIWEESTNVSVEETEEPSDEVHDISEEDSEVMEESQKKELSEEYQEPIRSMTEEEVSLFAPFIQTKSARIRLMKSLDQISLAAYTGNVFVTGETQEEALELAKSVVKEVQMTDRNFSGKVARVKGVSLNNKDMDSMVSKLSNGALIVEKASGMDEQTTKDLLKALNQEKTGIVVVLQDTKKAMNKMLEYFNGMKEAFNVHVEVEELGSDALVAYGKKYARYLEYSIDEMGVLALHTRIDAMQTSDHVATVADVREIIEEAIEKANRKSFRHFTDVLFAKRYDDDDMIILRERDFLE